ncbi:MAG: hypothetical protein M1839_005006 [Geoglossum umbratile]|nr:MAG: hypothetical protein M1839_005006 [Geoglossum umbratile]
MYSLPQEIIARIASYLDCEVDQSHIPLAFRQRAPSRLPPYATISRQWLYAIERRTFHTLRLKSTELHYFADILVGHRRTALAHLRFEVVLPAYDDAACARFEREKDRARNNEAFTDAIRGLFRVLKSWEGEDDIAKERRTSVIAVPVPTCSFALDLCEVYSPMDGVHRGLEKYNDDNFQYQLGRRNDLFHHRYEHSIIKILLPEDLPSFSCVSHFRVAVSYPRTVEPRSIAAMAEKLEGLRNIEWTLNDNEKKYVQVRQENRYTQNLDFAQSLPLLTRPPLQTLRLEYYHEPPSNHSFNPPPASLPPNPQIDHLSRSLHTLTLAPALTDIDLTGPIVISPSLFWLGEGEAPPLWPNVRRFHVTFGIETPDGGWYFERDPRPHEEEEDEDNEDDDDVSPTSEDDDEVAENEEEDDPLPPDTFHPNPTARLTGSLPHNSFRTFPSPTTIPPLLLSMARAAACMPVLRRFSLAAELHSAEGAQFEVMYLGKAEKCVYDRMEEGDEGKERVYWQVGGWRPGEEVGKAWDEGREGVLMRFLEW